MDLLIRKIKQVPLYFSKITLRKTLFYYMIIAIGLVVICIILTNIFCKNWEDLILYKYQEKEKIQLIKEIKNSKDTDAKFYISFNGQIYNYYVMKPLDKALMMIFSAIRNFSAIIYSISAIIIIVHLFYKTKLKEPIWILKEEMKYISRNDLSFECSYNSGDEMGYLCESFDKMRRQMITNQTNIWNLMEQQQKINAAFAHDLRTPLTVLHGYTDFLIKYYPQGKITEEKLLDTLKTMDRQIERLNKFTRTMNELTRFEEFEIVRKKESLKKIKKEIMATISALSNLHNIEITLEDLILDLEEEKKTEQNYILDHNIILEVIDNLLSNALRYAKSKIEITIGKRNDILEIYVKDDGRGFTKEEITMAAKPYFTDKIQTEEHFGLGLTICEMLCKKHGGRLTLFNSIEKGAIVLAEFFAS